MDRDLLIDIIGNLQGIVEKYDRNRNFHFNKKEDGIIRGSKTIPVIQNKLRHRYVLVPEIIYEASGIMIMGKRIKSLLFTTDLAIIRNNNADAIFAVYPFTPEASIMQASIEAASVPVFSGIGGGTTYGYRSVILGFLAELLGSYGVVVNAPMQNEDIRTIAKTIDIPIVASIYSEDNDLLGKVNAGAEIINVSSGKNTNEIVKKVREKLGPNFPIIATGGHTEEDIQKTLEAGANAITYVPPTSGEIFHLVMEEYRNKKEGS